MATTRTEMIQEPLTAVKSGGEKDATIITPTEKDIICGRSSATKTHAGNKMFRNIVSENKVRDFS